ncbi:MAG: flippase-like domain-containing protein [Rhodobacterales bacterium]|nr:flippase-like domain-containing protein [Rhodobacterales bacterium]MDX5414049.1 flippase-like domain-containing protein [Rhodobacterales bacterium]
MTSDNPEPFPPDDPRAGRPLAWSVSVVLFIAFSALGLWLAARVTGGSLPRPDPRLFQPASLALIAAFLAVFYLSDGLRLTYVLRALDVPVPLRKLFPLVFINILFSNVTPLASGGGFAQVWYLKRLGVPVGTSAAATTIRTILAMILIFLAAPLLQVIAPSPAIGGMGRVISQSVLVLVLVYLAGFIILLTRPFWLVRCVEVLLHGMQRIGLIGADRRAGWTAAINRETVAFGRGFRQFMAAPLRHSLGAVLWTLLFLSTLFAFPALIMVLLDYRIDWITVTGAVAVVTFLMYFAPTPGGAGFAELAFAGLMFTQTTSDDLVLVIFVWRFLTTYLGMALGVVVSVMVFAKAGRRS